ncbi:hypothetical protein AEAC466_02440 [Asticcacaulis sp. AC466]|uniref:AraC family transcriptional regulator n=1 Tax=Asticcacaulis sp. AC466 TaxID=1282362 RepID=UPI0003C3F1E5|nr:AraC family transcriptional regulator [Asticcacaulis sp. AC466]ESQ86066.1 hypothetical protein AEAC466_02440 [Asticcacaulis sp. AC466]
MSAATVSAGYTRALLDFAISKGASRRHLLERAGIAPSDLDDQDKRLPLSAFIALVRAGQVLCDSPALALQFSEGTRFEAFSIVGLICQSAPTMGEALKQLNRFNKLVIEIDGLTDGDRFQLTPRADGLWLEDRRPADAFPELTEAAFSRFICEVARHYGDTPFVKQIHVTHARPAHAAEYARILKVPVTFDSERNAMQIDASWLSLEINIANRYVFGIFSEHAEALMKSLESSKTVRGRVESLMIPHLHTGDLGMDSIAERMGLSRQALYRKLAAEATNFEQVLDDLRHRMAVHYLSGEKLSVNETAYLVGFSEPSAFSRAFKRWTGTSPRAHRRG